MTGGCRLNLGCGRSLLDGFTNIDIAPPADIVGDFTMMSFEGVDEVVMSHVLEHFEWRRTGEVLATIRKWCAPGAKVTIEVPDMAALCERGCNYPHWQQWIFGEQGREGQRHLSGFTEGSLAEALAVNGFKVHQVRRFISQHPDRTGYPCIEAIAYV